MPKHVLLIGSRAAAAAVYPDELCDTMCDGLKKQMIMDKDNQISTRAMNQGQLRSLTGNLKTGEKKIKKNHWVDIFHSCREGRSRSKRRAAQGLVEYDL